MNKTSAEPVSVLSRLSEVLPTNQNQKLLQDHFTPEIFTKEYYQDASANVVEKDIGTLATNTIQLEKDIKKALNKTQENTAEDASKDPVEPENDSSLSKDAITEHTVVTKSPSEYLVGISVADDATYAIPILLSLSYVALSLWKSEFFFTGLPMFLSIVITGIINIILFAITANKSLEVRDGIKKCVGSGGLSEISNSEVDMLYAGIISELVIVGTFIFLIWTSSITNTRFAIASLVLTIALIVIVSAFVIMGGIYLKAERCDLNISLFNEGYLGTLLFMAIINCYQLVVFSFGSISHENKYMKLGTLLLPVLAVLVSISLPTYWISLSEEDQEKTNQNMTIVMSIFGATLLGIYGWVIYSGWI